MAITVRSITEEFKIVLTAEGESASFFMRPLDYKTKSYITGVTVTVEQGEARIDSSLICFYNVKFGLKRVEGFLDDEGNEYALQFEDRTEKALTDACVDELFATQVSENLIYAAKEMSEARYPSEIKHPLTGALIEGISIITAEELKQSKKKS